MAPRTVPGSLSHGLMSSIGKTDGLISQDSLPMLLPNDSPANRTGAAAELVQRIVAVGGRTCRLAVSDGRTTNRPSPRLSVTGNRTPESPVASVLRFPGVQWTTPGIPGGLATARVLKTLRK